MDKDKTPTPSSQSAAKYRGAAVMDLQLPPAFCLGPEDELSRAIEAAYEREFDQLPILNENRRPLGYLDIKAVKAKFEAGSITSTDPIERYMTHFPRHSKSHPYSVITPDTPLEELEAFFRDKNVDFALVTDDERKWVLAVATPADLETFVQRRG